MHLMAQPDVAAAWLGDPTALGSRADVSRAGNSADSGERELGHGATPQSTSQSSAGKATMSVLGDILQRQTRVALGAAMSWPHASYPLSAAARERVDHVCRSRRHEGRQRRRTRSRSRPCQQAPEACRAHRRCIDAGGRPRRWRDNPATKWEAGIAIVEHYAIEALRLSGASRISADLMEAQRLLTWLLTTWLHPLVSLPDIYRLGPNSIRDGNVRTAAVTILAEHGWMATAPHARSRDRSPGGVAHHPWVDHGRFRFTRFDPRAFLKNVGHKRRAAKPAKPAKVRTGEESATFATFATFAVGA